jgi:hypothetical protein
MARSIVGFCVALVVAAASTTLICSLGSSVPGLHQLIRASDLDPAAPGTVFAWALLFALVATLFVAVPLHQWVRHRTSLGLIVHLLFGAVVGVTPFLLLAFLGLVRAVADNDAAFAGNTLPKLAVDAVVGAAAGALAAISFYFVAGAEPAREHHAV